MQWATDDDGENSSNKSWASFQWFSLHKQLAAFITRFCKDRIQFSEFDVRVDFTKWVNVSHFFPLMKKVTIEIRVDSRIPLKAKKNEHTEKDCNPDQNEAIWHKSLTVTGQPGVSPKWRLLWAFVFFTFVQNSVAGIWLIPGMLWRDKFWWENSGM